LATKPIQGYPSLSVVPTPLVNDSGIKDFLKISPYFPLSGINSVGLAISTYSVPECQPSFDDNKKSLYWIVFLRLILDQ
jgi:hypothetical protein